MRVMAEGKVTVVARIKAREGMEEEVRRALLALVAPTRAEAGCINYDLHQALDDRTLFIFYENWRSQADLDAHIRQPYIAAMFARQAELLAEPVEIRLLELIG